MSGEILLENATPHLEHEPLMPNQSIIGSSMESSDEGLNGLITTFLDLLDTFITNHYSRSDAKNTLLLVFSEQQLRSIVQEYNKDDGDLVFQPLTDLTIGDDLANLLIDLMEINPAIATLSMSDMGDDQDTLFNFLSQNADMYPEIMRWLKQNRSDLFLLEANILKYPEEQLSPAVSTLLSISQMDEIFGAEKNPELEPASFEWVNRDCMIRSEAVDIFLYQKLREQLVARGIIVLPTIRTCDQINLAQLEALQKGDPILYNPEMIVDNNELCTFPAEVRVPPTARYYAWVVNCDNIHYGVLFYDTQWVKDSTSTRFMYMEPFNEAKYLEAHIVTPFMQSILEPKNGMSVKQRSCQISMFHTYLAQLTKNLGADASQINYTFLGQEGGTNSCSDYVIAVFARLVLDINLDNGLTALAELSGQVLSDEQVHYLRWKQIELFGPAYFEFQKARNVKPFLLPEEPILAKKMPKSRSSCQISSMNFFSKNYPNDDSNVAAVSEALVKRAKTEIPKEIFDDPILMVEPKKPDDFLPSALLLDCFGKPYDASEEGRSLSPSFHTNSAAGHSIFLAPPPVAESYCDSDVVNLAELRESKIRNKKK